MAPSAAGFGTAATTTPIGIVAAMSTGRLQRMRSGWSPDPWVLAAWAGVVLAIVVTTVRAVNNGWVPVGDNALIGIRGHDVFTRHHPLLGTWSSASLSVGTDVNHPGPLFFDFVAPAVRLFGTRAGVALGAAAVNVLAVTTAVVFGTRRAGRVSGLGVAVVCALTGFVMGSELLFSPWNPHILLLPAVALIVLAWSIADGDRWALPVYLAIGSFCVQTHLGYAYLVPALVLLAYAARWLVGRWLGQAVRVLPARRTVTMSAVVVGLCWVQPLWEQLFGGGRGNMSRLLSSGGSGGPTIGVRLAVRIIASVTTRWPWQWRSGFVEAVPYTRYTESGALGQVDIVTGLGAVARMLVLVALFGLAARSAVRRRDSLALSALTIAAGVLAVAFVSLVIMPFGPLGLTAHQMRWLWPMSFFVWFALAFAAVRGLAALQTRPQVMQRALTAAVAVLAVATLPTYVQPDGPGARVGDMPLIRAFDAQLGSLEGRGVVWFDSSNAPFLEAVSAPMLAELQRRGIEFVVDEPGLVRQFGDARNQATHEWSVRLMLLYDAEALIVPEGATLDALVTPLSTADQAEFQSLAAALDAGELGDAQQARYDELAALAVGSLAAVTFTSAPDDPT